MDSKLLQSEKQQGRKVMKKRLFFDMDNVLVDFQSGLDKIDEETKVQRKKAW